MRNVLFLLLLLALPLTAATQREAALSSILFPIAGDVPGANGLFFQTDVTLANRLAREQRVDVFWLPKGRSSLLDPPAASLTLPPNSAQTFESFPTNTLRKSGLGAIIVRAVDAGGAPDPSARIDGFARVWTQNPNGAGTFAQGIHASSLAGPQVDDFQPIPAHAYGLRQDASFRTNFGFVNASDIWIWFAYRIEGTRRQSSGRVLVPPFAMEWFAVPAGDYGDITLTVEPEQIIPPTLNLGPWTAWGSSVDQATGDAWFSKVQAAYPHGPCTN